MVKRGTPAANPVQAECVYSSGEMLNSTFFKVQAAYARNSKSRRPKIDQPEAAMHLKSDRAFRTSLHKRFVRPPGQLKEAGDRAHILFET